MSNNIVPLISGQLSEHLREGSPLFVGFMDAFYQYASKRDSAIGVIQYHSNDIDIDLTTDDYVSKFYDTYGTDIPQNIAADRRNFIKLLNSVYNAKGTEKALKLIFRALFNEEIQVSYPSEHILKASDGIWDGESFFTVTTQYGSITDSVNILSFSNSHGDFTVESTRAENISQTAVRFYFKSYTPISVEDGQLIFIYADGVMTFAGSLIKSPSHLTIQSPGKSWQRGQVIVIPGTIKNTIARITAVDSQGGILNTEILEYGYVHNSKQTTTISPYPNKPVGSVVDIASNLVSINPNVYHHTIGIRDYIDGVYESVVGVSSGSGYSNRTDIATTSTQSNSISVVSDTGITIEDWIASRAVLVYDSSIIVKTKGYYRNENGQLSNQEIKTQDNYFYQAFSYLIETFRDISEFKSALKITHPAGTKLFSNLDKSVSYAPPFSAMRTLSHDTMYFIDLISTTEHSAFSLAKPVFEIVTLQDQLNSSMTKPLIETISVTDSANATTINMISGRYDLESYFEELYTTISNEYQLTIG
jgi:hypothetical protein